jgi:hypothetical protein
LFCLSFPFQFLITPLVSFGHCIVSPSIYVFWLPLCYLLVIVLSLLPFTASDYSFVIFWSLYCLSFHLVSDYTFCIFFCHCIISPSIYSFWLPLCYFLVIVFTMTKRYQRVIRSCKWKERQYNDQKIPKV